MLYYFKFRILTLLTIPSIVSVYQFVHIYMAPGIEPGHLPGPFLKTFNGDTVRSVI